MGPERKRRLVVKIISPAALGQKRIKMEKIIMTTLYKDASECNFDSFLDEALLNFENRIVNLYNYVNEPVEKNLTKEHAGALKFIKSSMYKTDFYKVFIEAGNIIPTYEGQFPPSLGFPSFVFRINTKNINFETDLHNVADKFAWGMQKRYIDPSSPFEHPEMPSELKEIPNWRDLFGKGEFPRFTIYTFRLGNTEYFAYTIGK